MTLADELQKLQCMREAGGLSEEEFQLAKTRLLRDQAATEDWNASTNERDAVPPPAPPVWDEVRARETRTWSTLIHLGFFCWFIPFGAVLVPLVIWLVQKDRFPGIDPHFRHLMNWVASLLIYVLCCIPLVFVLVGIPLLVGLGVCAIAFPIVAAVKASQGHAWRYPLSIPFFG